MEDLQLGLYVIKLMLLLVIAHSVYRIACYYSNSYMGEGNIGGRADDGLVSSSMNPRFHHETQGSLSTSYFSNNEAPAFWNLGDAAEINKNLQAGAAASRGRSNFESDPNQSAAEVSMYNNRVKDLLNEVNPSTGAPYTYEEAQEVVTSSLRGGSSFFTDDELQKTALIGA
jgi:hypothetical protein